MSNPNQKIRFARNAKAQKAEKFDEIIAFIGSNAEPYNKVERELILQTLQLPFDYKAVFIGKEELDRLPDVRLTPIGNECKLITFYQMGEVTAEQYQRLELAIFRHQPNLTSFQIIDVAGNPIKDKDGKDVQEGFRVAIERYRAELISEALIQDLESKKKENKTQPYFEERIINGVKGIYYIKPPRTDRNGNVVEESASWTCDPLTLKGEGYSESNEAYYMFEWLHPLNRKPQTEAIPLSSFGKPAGWEMLQRYGLKMTNRPHLNQLADHFHHSGNHATKWTVTETTGWKNGAYLLPSGEIIGQPTSPVFFKNKDDGPSPYETAGTLESWRREIGDNLRGNPFLITAVATSLAGPLLKILRVQSFGVHLYNDSTRGKTTSLNIANSIWGDPESLRQKWDQTSVAMMNNAQSKNDNFLTLDEMSQCSNIDYLEQSAYLFFNETGRVRGKKDGGNQLVQKWKLTILSTGELDLEGFLQKKNKDIQSGSLVRLLNIPMTSPQKLHQFKTSKEHADHLNEACLDNYGVLGREWIAFIISNREAIKSAFKHYKGLWLERMPTDVDPQVQRVISNFAILETALQLASPLTQWSEEENREAIIKAFNSWLAVFGTRSKEETNIIEAFNGWLLQAQHANFIEVRKEFALGLKPTREIAGYKMTTEATGKEKEFFYIYPRVFREITKGRANEVVYRALSSVNILDKILEDNARPYQKKIPRALEKNQPYCFVVYHLEE